MEGVEAREGTPERESTLTERLARSFRLTLSLIAGTVAITTVAFAAILWFVQPDVDRFLEAHEANDELHEGMLGQETGLRGYLLTKDDDFLDPYRRGLEQVDAKLHSLFQLTASDPRLVEQVVATSRAIEAWREGWAVPAIFGPVARAGANRSEDFQARGKALFDKYRATQSELSVSIARGLDSARERLYLLLATAAGLELLLCAAGFFLGRRQSRDLRSSIVQPVRGLLHVMESARQGHLSTDVPTSGPLELRQIAASLREMNEALLRQRELAEAREAQTRRTGAFVELVGTVAAAANQAGTIEEALRTVLDQVCAFTGWPVGHAHVRGTEGVFRSTGIWHLDEPEHFTVFRHATEDPSFDVTTGLGAEVVRTGRPQWITAFPYRNELQRSEVAGEVGLQTALAFPITLHGEIAAILEFFSTEDQPENLELLDMLTSVGIQLTRLFEREESELKLQEANAQLSGWIEELEKRNVEARLLNEMGDLLQTCESPEEAYVVLRDTCSGLFAGDCGALYTRNPSRTLVELVATWGMPAGHADAFRPDDCWALRRGNVYTVSADRRRPLCRHVDSQTTAMICVPMTSQGETSGLFHLRVGGSDISDDALAHKEQMALQVAERMALALANFRLRDKLRRQSIRDPLTDLFNRRYIQETLDRETSRAKRSDRPLTVVMLDIDHFKRFNDTFGHDAGDAVLKLVAATLVTEIRAEDIACRYGGEEFLLVLPDAAAEDARRRAEYLRRQVAELEPVYRGRNLDRINLSLGVATYPRHGASWEELIQAADAALYRAKREGRNRVVVARDEPAPV